MQQATYDGINATTKLWKESDHDREESKECPVVSLRVKQFFILNCLICVSVCNASGGNGNKVYLS